MRCGAGNLLGMSAPAGRPPATPSGTTIDVRERGANEQSSTRRLFVQLQVFGGCGETKPVVAALESSHIDAVLYADVNDPRGVAVVGLAEDPAFFVTGFRDLLGSQAFAGLTRNTPTQGEEAHG